MNISDKAAEAAARALKPSAWDERVNWGDEDSREIHQNHYKSVARTALNAAAPHMLADTESEIEKLRAHILDIDAHATPFGDIPNDPGYIGAYLVSAGSLHRALGTIGHTAPSCEAEAELRELRAVQERTANPYRSQA